MSSGARARYAPCGDVEIAYQVLGDGPVDVLLYTGTIIPIECMDEEPALNRFQRRLTSFSRLLRFDKRGTGMSDRGSSTLPAGDELAQDGLAVLDAAGSDRAAVIAPYNDSPGGLVLAALHPERVSALVVVNGLARLAWAPDYPAGVPLELLKSSRERLPETDAVEQGFDLLAAIAPTVAGDPAFRAWWDRSGNLGLTPAAARERSAALYDLDVREFLPMIRVPTLVLQRADLQPAWGVGHGRYLAEHIAGAKYVELPGPDVLYWVGDFEPVLDEIEEFVTGVRGGAERVLSTVLFTDIVGSTDRAAQLGDARWRDLLDRHDQTVRAQLERFRGREVKTVGDGFVATFDSPGRAIDCALAVREALSAFDVDVRAGLHAGEIEVRGGDVAGLAVHIGARVSALAAPGEVWVSSTVKDLVVGSNVEFSARGEHELKGVPGTWALFAVDA
jgi:class 3 adenylate cyclase